MFLNKKSAIFKLFTISIFGCYQIFAMKQNNINNNSENKKVFYDEKIEQNLLEKELYNALELSFSKIDSKIDLRSIKKIINKGVVINNLNAHFSEFAFILIYTSVEASKIKSDNCLKIFKLLMKLNSFNVNIENSQACTLLNWAILSMKTEFVKILLKNPKINVNYFNQFSATTPLILSVRKAQNKVDITNILLNHPSINIFLVDPYTKDSFKTALEYSKENLDSEIKNAIKYANKKNKNPEEQLIALKRESCYMAIINKLNELRASLFDAIKQDKKDSFDKFNFCLIKLGAYVKDEQGNNILHCAINFKNKDYIYEILSIAPDLLYIKNKAGIAPFDLALQNMSNDKENIMKIILDFAHKFKATKDQETKLITNNNTENGKVENGK